MGASSLWLVAAVACLWIGVGAQDLSALKYKLQELEGYFADEELELFSDLDEPSSLQNHLKTAKESLQNLNAFWTPDANILDRFNAGNESGNLSEECIEGAFKLLMTTDPTTSLPLIVKMIDAFGKIGPGFFEGNSYAKGAYDECLNIGPGDAEYCLGDVSLKVKSPYPLTWHFGMCVPRGCTPEDIIFAIDMLGMVTVDPKTVSCQSTRKPPFNTGAIIMIVVCFIFVILVIAATIFDFILQLLQTETVELESSHIKDSLNLSEKVPLLIRAKSPPLQGNAVKATDFIIAFSLYKVLS